LTSLPELWSDPDVRMNEGGCDPDGRFYCGAMAYDQSVGRASLYRLDPDGSVEVVLEHVMVSNGLEWSPDGSRAYYNDTATLTVTVFDYDAAAGLTNRRTFAELPDGGRPDGLTVDAGVWTAVSNGGAIYHYSAEGRLAEKLAVPTRKVTRLHLRRRAPRPAVYHHLPGEHRHARGPARRVSVPGRRRRQRSSGPPLRGLRSMVRCHRRSVLPRITWRVQQAADADRLRGSVIDRSDALVRLVAGAIYQRTVGSPACAAAFRRPHRPRVIASVLE
jgi:SMP-30/Gluconolactonase/LRE-like region